MRLCQIFVLFKECSLIPDLKAFRKDGRKFGLDGGPRNDNLFVWVCLPWLPLFCLTMFVIVTLRTSPIVLVRILIFYFEFTFIGNDSLLVTYYIGLEEMMKYMYVILLQDIKLVDIPESKLAEDLKTFARRHNTEVTWS